VNAMGTAARVDRISFRRPNFHAKAEAALEELVKAGRGNWTTEPPPVTGGHSRRVFVLSTLSTSTLAREMQENRPSVDVDTVDAGKTETPASDGRNGLFGDYASAGPYRDGF
jgi:hypothetical protein